MAGNRERLILYALVSILGIFLCVFLILSCRLFCQKRRALRQFKKSDVISSPASNLTIGQSRELIFDDVNLRAAETSQATFNQGSNGPSTVQPSPSSHYETQYQPLTVQIRNPSAVKEEARYTSVPIGRNTPINNSSLAREETSTNSKIV